MDAGLDSLDLLKLARCVCVCERMLLCVSVCCCVCERGAGQADGVCAKGGVEGCISSVRARVCDRCRLPPLSNNSVQSSRPLTFHPPTRPLALLATRRPPLSRRSLVSEALGLALPSTLLFDCPSVEALAAYCLASQVRKPVPLPLLPPPLPLPLLLLCVCVYVRWCAGMRGVGLSAGV
jgi:hypothetical protein